MRTIAPWPGHSIVSILHSQRPDAALFVITHGSKSTLVRHKAQSTLHHNPGSWLEATCTCPPTRPSLPTRNVHTHSTSHPRAAFPDLIPHNTKCPLMRTCIPTPMCDYDTCPQSRNDLPARAPQPAGAHQHSMTEGAPLSTATERYPRHPRQQHHAMQPRVRWLPPCPILLAPCC